MSLKSLHYVFALFTLLPEILTSAPAPRPLYEQGREAIINNYTFVNDFSVKETERDVSNELFWRYPFKVPKIVFEINDKIEDAAIEIPKTSIGDEFHCCPETSKRLETLSYQAERVMVATMISIAEMTTSSAGPSSNSQNKCSLQKPAITTMPRLKPFSQMRQLSLVGHLS